MPIDRTQKCSDDKLEFYLAEIFSSDHQINLIFVDKRKGHAYFCTQSAHILDVYAEDGYLNHIHFIKIALNE